MDFRINRTDATGNVDFSPEFGRDVRIHDQHIDQRLVYRQRDLALLKSCNDVLCRYVSNERILRERASPKTADGGIDTPAACIISSEDPGHGLDRCTMKMDSNVVAGVLVNDRLNHTA